ncbi:MAG: hypothetical protein R6V04_00630 [bacterium]
MKKTRQDQDPPLATEKWGWRYHHLGIPTNQSIRGERYIPHLKIYVTGFETSPFGIEWMRFEKDSPVPELIRSVPHLAFEVNDMDKILDEGSFEILSEIQSPSKGVRVAMIKHNGAPVELIQFDNKKKK